MAPAQKSIVWLFFEKSSDNKYADCTLCKQKLKYFTSTGNLRQHIRKHPIQYHEQMNESIPNETDPPSVTPQSEISNAVEDAIMSKSQLIKSINVPSTSAPDNISSHAQQVSSSKLFSNSESAQSAKRKRQLKLYGGRNLNELTDVEKTQCDLSLLKLIVKDFQPLSIVENAGFLEYSKSLNKSYKVPSRYILTNNLLLKRYSEEVVKLKSLLREVKYVSLTTDIWQSDSNMSYLSLTCHFVHNGTLHSRVLSTKEMTSEHHTGHNIASDMRNIIAEWEIDTKIVTIVSDNGVNVKNAITEYLRKYHHPCVTHTLNLIMKESLKENDQLKDLITKCKNLVAYFKHSGLATGKLRKCQQDMGLPSLKIKQSVETRWNSILIMLERLLELKNPLSVTITSLPPAPDFIDAAEWNIISDCVPILKPLELMTTELSGEKYITMSTIIPLIRGLQFNLRNMKPTTAMGLWLQSKLLETTSRRLGLLETNKIVAKSTFLDPRLKKTAFGLEDNAKNTQSWIMEEIAAMMSNSNTGTSLEVNDSNIPRPPEDSNPTTNNMSLWSHFKGKLKEVTTKTTPTTSSILTVRQYLELPHCTLTSNPLEFWEKHKLMLPELYELHTKYAGIPATSVPSERLFSKAGQLANLRRNRMSPKHVDAILFLNAAL